MNNPCVIVALDYPDTRSALDLVQRLDSTQCRVKVGHELFTAGGPGLVEELVRRGFGVFLDLKFHDIPNTVAGACRAAAQLGVWMLNVHASGGKAMMQAAREAVAPGAAAPKLIAVTLLTSMGQPELDDVGFAGAPQEIALRLALLAKGLGLDGVVCSAREAAALRAACGKGFSLVTPGIRPADALADDQQRIMSASGAIESGADYLVIGRPITRAPDPLAALAGINAEIASTMRAL